jgi:hypothetical protein
MQKAGMGQNFSWQISAQKYLDLYNKLIQDTSIPVAEETYPTSPITSANRIQEEQGVEKGEK